MTYPIFSVCLFFYSKIFAFLQIVQLIIELEFFFVFVLEFLHVTIKQSNVYDTEANCFIFHTQSGFQAHISICLFQVVIFFFCSFFQSVQYYSVCTLLSCFKSFSHTFLFLTITIIYSLNFANQTFQRCHPQTVT